MGDRLTGGQTDRQTRRWTDRQRDRRAEGQIGRLFPSNQASHAISSDPLGRDFTICVNISLF